MVSVLRSLLKDVSHYFSRQAVNQRLNELATRINPCDKYARCMGCDQCKPHHYIPYGTDDGSVFPYCEECHQRLNISEKVYLVDQLMGWHMKSNPYGHQEIYEKFQHIRRNVEAGL